jgi:hypothetical protein
LKGRTLRVINKHTWFVVSLFAARIQFETAINLQRIL